MISLVIDCEFGKQIRFKDLILLDIVKTISVCENELYKYKVAKNFSEQEALNSYLNDFYKNISGDDYSLKELKDFFSAFINYSPNKSAYLSDTLYVGDGDISMCVFFDYNESEYDFINPYSAPNACSVALRPLWDTKKEV